MTTARLAPSASTATPPCRTASNRRARPLRSAGASGAARVFFFQAEDGIRDYKVTGVQTCALPIYPTPGALQIVFADLGTPKRGQWSVYDELRDQLAVRGVPRDQVRFVHEARNDREKIGRASCRERV